MGVIGAIRYGRGRFCKTGPHALGATYISGHLHINFSWKTTSVVWGYWLEFVLGPRNNTCH